MNARVVRQTLGLILAALPMILVGCSGSGSSNFGNGTGTGTQSGNVDMMVSDASTEDWANIGIKILSISLIPQGGGTNVTVYNADESTAPMINLVQLDQLGEILGNASVPAGTYTGALLTISGNPSDIQLTPSADPSANLLALANASTPISTGQIDVQNTTGAAPNATVSVTVNFVSPLVVTANSTDALDLEIDLSHPAFLVGNMAGGSAVWAVNFKGPWHHHPIPDLTKFLLRDIYGTVTSVNSDGSITITRDFPVEPAAATASSEAVISTTHSITILPDSTNGTLFYDVDNTGQNQTIKSYSTVSSDLPVGQFVRVTARFQTGGTLVAVRTWASSSFGKIYVSPEGHVLHVNTNTNVIDVENEIGLPVHLTVNANTMFYSGSTQIGEGTSFLTNIKRGFKIHASLVDPLASPLVAQTVNVEIARYDGSISAANLNGFTYTRNFSTARDSYVVTLPYASTGFEWWNFTFPTVVDSGTNAIPDFISATNGGVTFGGTPPINVSAYGQSFATWNGSTWSVPWTVLMPTPVQLAATAQGFSSGTPNGTITINVPGGTNAVTVDMSTVAGSGTLVYQISRTGLIVTVTPEDITTSEGQSAVTTTLVSGTKVAVDGVPQANGTIKAYVVIYYTGIVPPTAVD